MKVYQVYYNYVEKYCSPNPDNWSDERHVIATTLDESYARELADEHNKTCHVTYTRRAYVDSFELVSRP